MRFILRRANDDTAKRRRVRGDVPRPFASRSAARCTGRGTDDGNTPPRGSPPSGRRWAASKPRTPHRRASRAPETHWCRENAQKLTVCAEKTLGRKARNAARCRRWKNHGRFRKSALLCAEMSGRDVFSQLRTRARRLRVPEVTAREMLSLAMRPHAAMGEGRLARQTVFIKQSSVKRDALPRRLLGGNSHRRVSGKNARVAATRGGITAASGEQQEANEPYRFEEMCTTTLIAAVSASALLVRPADATPPRPPREKSEPVAETDDASSPSRAVFLFFYSHARRFFRRALRESFRMSGSARRTEGLLSRRCVASSTSR